MKKLLTLLVLVGLLLSLQVSFVSAQESDPPDVTTYKVKKGDTWDSIAEEFDISVEALLAANELSDDVQIEDLVGETLVIPAPAGGN